MNTQASHTAVIAPRFVPSMRSHAGLGQFTAPSGPSPKDNRLLAALPEADYLRLLPHLEPFSVALGGTISNPCGTLSHIHFPTGGIIARVGTLQDGSSSEVSLTGSEGLIGLYLFLGGSIASPRQTVVLCPAHGYRMKAAIFQEEFERSSQLRRILLLYTQTLVTQVAQQSACNRRHRLEQRFASLLLQILDRIPSSKFAMTQEMLAAMLGVRREGVTEAALAMQRDGAIQYRRGHIAVLDRRKLAQRACECYEVVSKECDRLFFASDKNKARGYLPVM